MIQSQSVYSTINIINGNQEYQFLTLLVMNMRYRYSIMINLLESLFVTWFNKNTIGVGRIKINFILAIIMFHVYIYKTSNNKVPQHQNLIGLSFHASIRKMTRTASNNKFKSVAIFAILNSVASNYSINTN